MACSSNLVTVGFYHIHLVVQLWTKRDLYVAKQILRDLFLVAQQSHLMDGLPFRCVVLSNVYLMIYSPAARAGARAVVVKVRPTVRRARMRADPMACLLAARPWMTAMCR
jgi:hypothetical protein